MDRKVPVDRFFNCINDLAVFDFQKLSVYQKSKSFCKDTRKLIEENNFDRATNDQLRRACLSIMLNIAEGSSRFSNPDRRHFMIIARGSAFECAALLEFLAESHDLKAEKFESEFDRLDEISRMLFALIKKLS